MMAGEHAEGTHPADQTSGSPQRPAHQLAPSVLNFDLATEVAHLHSEESWQQGTRNARTLVKEPDFRIVVVAMHNGARLEEHRAPGRISIHTLRGRLRVRVGDDTVDLPAGHILSLEPHIAHDVEACEESAFLLTIAWPARSRAAPVEQGGRG
jgi:quercetin dioxygenase-like cupin family protein